MPDRGRALMAYRFTSEDVAYLSSPDRDEALGVAAGLALDGDSLIADLTRLRRSAGEHAGAVAETVRLRRRAEQRWGERPDGWSFTDWLFTDTALQQASPPAVAAHRARRIAGWLAGSGWAGVHDVTCSIGTDLAALATAGSPGGAGSSATAVSPGAARSPGADRFGATRGFPPVAKLLVVGSDLDSVRLTMAQHNLRRSGLAARLVRADARTVTTRGLLLYADPARRDVTGRRISSADTIPPVADLDSADPAHPPVLRLPPGIDYPALNRPGEIEIVSWRGVVREAVSWPPALASARRRATVLAGDGGVEEQLTDDEPDDAPVTAPGAFLIDPDPAIVRAHLVRHYAIRHRLSLLDEHLAYLTGPVPPPGVRAFEIIDVAAHSERTVREWARRDRVGTLEIKQRGTPVVPDELRRRIRPTGDTRIARTLVIARIGRDTRAFWCRAVPPAGS